MQPEVRLLALGERAWTVEFGDSIDPLLHRRVMGFCGAIAHEVDRGALAGIVDVVPTFRSATVHYDPMQIDGALLGDRLMALSAGAAEVSAPGMRWRIPVEFGGERGADLAAVAAQCGLTVEAVVDILTTTTFEAYVMGFMPGFAYMGVLPPQLELPRLTTPRKRVPARTLAIAGRLCGVYPYDSPGGWHLVGAIPLPLFDLTDEARPSLFAVGDSVTWYAVDTPEFERLAQAVAGGDIDRAYFAAGANP